jgi:hypothetical protein
MRSNEGFGVCKEGLSSLTDAMMTEFIALGGTIIMDTELLSLTNNFDSSISLNCKLRNSSILKRYRGNMVVLALHQQALKDVEGINKLPVLKNLEMTPLLRIYAIFPTRKNVSWFSGLGKIVTNSSIRYIIPIDPTHGIVMISYTDGLDAAHWIKQDDLKHGDDNVQDLVMTEVRKLFPERTIPDPIFFKQHPWYEGCTYWLPGDYSVKEESEKSLHPMPKEIPNLYMCGESFSVKQCWIESALCQADELLNNSHFKITLRNIT